MQLLSTEEIDESRLSILCGFIWDCRLFNWFLRGSLPLALSRLATCHHLQSITIDRCDISSLTMDVLAQVNSLHTVNLRHCSITLPNSPNKPWPRRRWKSLTEVDVGSTSVQRSWLISSIQQLVDIEYLQFFHTGGFSITDTLFKGRIAPHLEELVLASRHISSLKFCQILESAPSLTKLVSQVASWTRLVPASSRVIPRLQSLECYPFLAAELISGRPISSLTLLDPRMYPWLQPDQPEVDLSTLQGSTAGIRELSIMFYRVNEIHQEHFPDLETLVIRPRCGRKVQMVQFAVCNFTLCQTDLRCSCLCRTIS